MNRSAAGSASAPRHPPVWPLYRAMVGVGLFCGLLIVLVFETTRPVIARNRAAALERAILEVLPGAVRHTSFRRVEAGGFEPVSDAQPDSATGTWVHAGFDEEGGLVGVAAEAASMGYQDTIRLLFGYSFEEHAVIGIEVLESRETPGLGDRIETDPEFLRNFERLEVALDDAGAAVLHPIEAVKHGEKTEPWQIDGITGATISSVAVAAALREATGEWVPILEGRKSDFRKLEE